MTKALTITPKISQTYNGTKSTKATRGIVGTVIDIFKAIAKKISTPEDAVSKISKNTTAPSHKDPAAIVMKTMHG